MHLILDDSWILYGDVRSISLVRLVVTGEGKRGRKPAEGNVGKERESVEGFYRDIPAALAGHARHAGSPTARDRVRAALTELPALLAALPRRFTMTGTCRLDLDPNWSLVQDATCVTLVRKVVVTGENTRGRKAKAENIGKSRDSACGYFGSIPGAVEGWVNASVITATTDIGPISLDDLVARLGAALDLVRGLPARLGEVRAVETEADAASAD
jgi:hypothetical protein